MARAEDGNPGDACRVHWQCLGMVGSSATFPFGQVLLSPKDEPTNQTAATTKTIMTIGVNMLRGIAQP